MSLLQGGNSSYVASTGNVMFVDISVPRNVHADCASVAGALCYNVDHLKAVVQRNTNKRKREMLEAESILKEEQNKFRVSILLLVTVSGMLFRSGWCAVLMS
jgi:glutamyl-tRNA reductase